VFNSPSGTNINVWDARAAIARPSATLCHHAGNTDMAGRRPKPDQRAPRPLLAFDAHFVADDSHRVYLWAEHQSRSRIRFEIGPDVLSEVLGGANPVHDDENLALCRRERLRIVAACSNALRRSALNEIRLEPRDFD
jgi:hypothetical protein